MKKKKIAEDQPDARETKELYEKVTTLFIDENLFGAQTLAELVRCFPNLKRMWYFGDHRQKQAFEIGNPFVAAIMDYLGEAVGPIRNNEKGFQDLIQSRNRGVLLTNHRAKSKCGDIVRALDMVLDGRVPSSSQHVKMINVNPANPLQFENMLCTEFLDKNEKTIGSSFNF